MTLFSITTPRGSEVQFHRLEALPTLLRERWGIEAKTAKLWGHIAETEFGSGAESFNVPAFPSLIVRRRQ